MLMMIANELTTSLIISIICIVTVLIILPRKQYLDDNNEIVDVNRAWIAFKTFIISFILSYMVFYFFASDQTSSLISNMKSGDPPF